jgi:hypothetical protein
VRREPVVFKKVPLKGMESYGNAAEMLILMGF